MNSFDRLLEIMEKLRSEGGCPWDREQSRHTLKKYLLEEAYEALEALDSDDPGEIKEELGDLLFQIVFQCQIGRERGEFTMDDVIEKISAKMVHRHPHVFGDEHFGNSAEVLKQWEERKREEGKSRESILEGIPRELPALLRARRIQSRAARVGFDWDTVDDAVTKLDEEVNEFKDALRRQPPGDLEEEFGDLLFSLVNISRFLGINPEDALRKTIVKFTGRFQYIERKAAVSGLRLSEMSLSEMDRLWEEAKEA